jgi:hypothetical protein
MRKKITISQFSDELIARIEKSKGIDCCKTEIKNLAAIAKDKIGNEQIEVEWKDN